VAFLLCEWISQFQRGVRIGSPGTLTDRDEGRSWWLACAGVARCSCGREHTGDGLRGDKDIIISDVVVDVASDSKGDSDSDYDFLPISVAWEL
jgi:hypothetical protein